MTLQCLIGGGVECPLKGENTVYQTSPDKVSYFRDKLTKLFSDADNNKNGSISVCEFYELWAADCPDICRLANICSEWNCSAWPTKQDTYF